MKDRNQKLFGKVIVESFHREKMGDFDWTNWRTSSTGKPYLDEGFQFSITHSGDVVCVAFSEHEVGVDAELVNELDNSELLNYFHPLEKEYIEKSPTKNADFYKLWTRKEAFLKGMGVGIVNGLNEHNCLQKKVLVTNGCWHLHSLNELTGYALAVCTPLANNQIIIKEVEISRLETLINN
jgi:4'-phosphopantetheinyl transferase